MRHDLPNVRAGDADAGSRAHGVEKVAEQSFQRAIEGDDGPGRLPQSLVGKFHNIANGHADTSSLKPLGLKPPPCARGARPCRTGGGRSHAGGVAARRNARAGLTCGAA